MRELFQKLNKAQAEGRDAVLVSIVASSGSVPRGSGALMLVTGDGSTTGTVGGGGAEYKAEQTAGKVLSAGTNLIDNYKLYHTEANDIDSICGGDQEVFFRVLKGEDTAIGRLCGELEAMYETGEQCWLIEEITEDSEGVFAVYSPAKGTFGISAEKLTEALTSELSASPKIVETAGKRFFTMRLVSPGRVFIFGGGHVSQQLVPTLARCDFRCIVLEDRPEFADPALFEGMCSTRIVNMDELEPVAEELRPDDYVCIMTRGHRNDYEVVYHMLKSKACYIGVIGSRKKVATLKEHLISDGFTEKDLERLTMPIGIEICSETPAEIAVSVTAQLILVRAQNTGSRKLKHLNEGMKG